MRPLCRCCGKQLAKITRENVFAVRLPGDDVPVTLAKEGYATLQEIARDLGDKPRNMVINTSNYRTILVDKIPADPKDLIRHTNRDVVSVKKNRDGTIRSFADWDGASYEGPFCSLRCGSDFGRLAVEHTTLETQAYADAIAAQAAKA